MHPCPTQENPAARLLYLSPWVQRVQLVVRNILPASTKENVDSAQSPGEALPGPAKLCKSHREAHDARWNEKPKGRNFLCLSHPFSAPAALLPLRPLPISPLTPSLSPIPPSHHQFGRISPKQVSGTLCFQSLKEARAQRSLLYHKLEHEKLIHFIHLSEGERERGEKISAARLLIANLSCWRAPAEVEVFTEWALAQNSKAGHFRAISGAKIEFSSQTAHRPTINTSAALVWG